MATNGSNHKDRSLVVVQLSGGNDCLNTVVPYTNGHYYDHRPSVAIKEGEVLKIDDELGFSPHMGPIKNLWDEGKVAIIQGIGYPNPNRSHFRSMDVWHTAVPDKVGADGWLGRAIREIDPNGENVLTGVNFGRGLPRSLAAQGVSVASVGNLETYGLFPDMKDESLRKYALDAFSMMYGGSELNDSVAEFFGRTGTDALKGADTLRIASEKYSSDIEYADSPIADSLKGVAQVMFADLGTRIFYTQHGSFDTHAGELEAHGKLWDDVSVAIGDFTDDLREHGREEQAMILVFSEFGRRIQDNGTGTDHGSGSVAFVIGGGVEGGLYGEYPSLKEEDQLEGDLQFNNDFRSTYSTIVEQWLGLDGTGVISGNFEQLDFVSK